jgi:hypothetical protein
MAVKKMALSVLVTLLLFVGVGNIPHSFFSTLVTLDGILIAVIGLVTPIAVKVIGLDELKQFFNEYLKASSGQDGQHSNLGTRMISEVSSFGSTTISTVMMLAPLLATLPYFISAILELAAMLRTDTIALILGAIGFWLMLEAFISTVAFLVGIVVDSWSGLDFPILEALLDLLTNQGTSVKGEKRHQPKSNNPTGQP